MPFNSLKIVSIIIALSFQLLTLESFGQESFRRHFIIAYDVSTPFVNSEKNCNEFAEALKDLLSNEPVKGFNDSQHDNIGLERKNGIPFFDKNLDEITFFHFNIARSEFDELRDIASKNDSLNILLSFNEKFIKEKRYKWSSFSTFDNATPRNYINHILSRPQSPEKFGRGVTMSNFVYPLIFESLKTNSYSEEYIIIILSDYLTGSSFGNMRDLDRVRDIYSVSYNSDLQSGSAVSVIKNNIDRLSSKFYRLDYFQYSFLPHNSNDPIGILSHKVKPKIGVLTPEDVALFVDGDLGIDQDGYGSRLFKMNETQLKFTHNNNLKSTSLIMSISLPGENGNIELFSDVVAKLDVDGNWSSNYTDSPNLMNFDSATLSYHLPEFEFLLDTLINKRKFDNLNVNFKFFTSYTFKDNQSLNFIYTTNRAIPLGSIAFSTKTNIIIMYYIIPILATIALLLLIAFYGRPQRLNLSLDGYLDSFEKIDYKTVGKLTTPFKAWKSGNQNVDFIPVHGMVLFNNSNYPLNWKSPIYLKLETLNIPDGFELFLKSSADEVGEFSNGNRMTLSRSSNNKFNFVVGIRHNNIAFNIEDPELVRFKIEAVINDTNLLVVNTNIHNTLEYKFHIGPSLEDVWVGFDPGTTGSCVAIGSSTNSIVLAKDKGNTNIIPSILTFDKTSNFNSSVNEISDDIYDYGSAAEALSKRTSRYRSFRSIKKLLGYKDEVEINFENGQNLKLNGKDLASLLVKGLNKDIEHFIKTNNLNEVEYFRNDQFKPLRAVVAIPNNFTISKIQDMIDCVANLKQFKEIRYVYEAEAVLFYYLSNLGHLNIKNETINSESILVFDMGGATINATVVTTNKTSVRERTKYDIDFLGKIGYSVGGDTIDYVLSKFILSHNNEFPEFNTINILEKKNELSQLALDLKIYIINNFNKKNNYLITAKQLSDTIQKHLNVNINIDAETSVMYKYFLKTLGKYRIFEHPYFIDYIYNNVKDATNEVIDLSYEENLDKVIFSGRSTQFPMIKETVEKQLKERNFKAKSIALDLEESKIAVATGAAWYGINKNSVRLNNLKTNASFGFSRTLSADKTDIEFIELVEMGCAFDTDNDGIDSFKGVNAINEDFAFDGNKVNFYQIMGKDADTILSKHQKHKFSKIASIGIDLVTSEIAMKVNENDEVDCAVKLQSNQILREKGVVSDQDISEANEEHYTWIVK